MLLAVEPVLPRRPRSSSGPASSSLRGRKTGSRRSPSTASAASASRRGRPGRDRRRRRRGSASAIAGPWRRARSSPAPHRAAPRDRARSRRRRARTSRESACSEAAGIAFELERGREQFLDRVARFRRRAARAACGGRRAAPTGWSRRRCAAWRNRPWRGSRRAPPAPAAGRAQMRPERALAAVARRRTIRPGSSRTRARPAGWRG